MTRRPFALLSAFSLASVALAIPLAAQTGVPPAEYVNEPMRYTANQLDNLVGPIALYPDALLAQVLVAATFPASTPGEFASRRKSPWIASTNLGDPERFPVPTYPPGLRQ